MSYTAVNIIELPHGVELVFREFRMAEMTTLAKDGTPITWSTLPFWRPEEGRFLITTSIGLPHKAFNIRRNPRVSLFFSDPMGSGLAYPPAVLVQGDAEAPDEVMVSVEDLEDELEETYRRQPAAGMYSSNPLLRGEPRPCPVCRPTGSAPRSPARHRSRVARGALPSGASVLRRRRGGRRCCPGGCLRWPASSAA